MVKLQLDIDDGEVSEVIREVWNRKIRREFLHFMRDIGEEEARNYMRDFPKDQMRKLVEGGIKDCVREFNQSHIIDIHREIEAINIHKQIKKKREGR